MQDWTGNKKSVFTSLGASNHTDKERQRTSINIVLMWFYPVLSTGWHWLWKTKFDYEKNTYKQR